MNVTLEKFGWPATLVKEFEHWVVLARPAQPTLGSLVLAAKSDATAFGDLPGEAHAELKQATTAIEAALSAAVGYARLNYLMLMMVDPQRPFPRDPPIRGITRMERAGIRRRGLAQGAGPWPCGRAGRGGTGFACGVAQGPLLIALTPTYR